MREGNHMFNSKLRKNVIDNYNAAVEHYETNETNETSIVRKEKDLAELTERMLLDEYDSIRSDKVLSVPIAGLSALGVGVSSMIPALNTITHTITIPMEGVYKVANAELGDVLKMAKDGNFWGAIKTADNTSKMAKFQALDPLSATIKTAPQINPAIMIMAVALFSIEKELKNIEKIGKQILSFLEIEKESEIEADVKILMNIMEKYKHNWDNEYFVSSNHKLVLDIQRTARKNINSYQRKINEVFKGKNFVVPQNKVKSTLEDLQKKFKYYRLSLYTFSLASLEEIILSGNFKENYILSIKDEIKEMSQTYRNLFDKCSFYLEDIGNLAIETNVVKGIGVAGKAVGKFISNIPIVKEGKIDEFLQDKGEDLENSVEKKKKKYVVEFERISNPETSTLIEKMQDLIQIYNYTSEICFDKEKIYLINSSVK
jgi:hypothetical protein